MARIRTIKPEFWTDEKLAPLPAIVRLTFLGLVSMADDAGRLVDSVKHLDGLLFAESDDSCGESLKLLEECGCIQRGVAENGRRVIQITGWTKHQRVDKPNKLACLPEIKAIRDEDKNHSGQRTELVATDSGVSRELVGPRPTTDDLRSTTDDPRPTTEGAGHHHRRIAFSISWPLLQLPPL